MPTSAEPVEPSSSRDSVRYAVDTSVAVAALDSGHTAHQACVDVVRRLRPSLAGHAAAETYAVLTRMPGPLAVDAPTARDIIERVFPEVSWLDPSHATALLHRLGTVGIVGGAVYDALVAEAARTAERVLLTRDRRARSTYDLIGVRHQVVGD